MYKIKILIWINGRKTTIMSNHFWNVHETRAWNDKNMNIKIKSHLTSI